VLISLSGGKFFISLRRMDEMQTIVTDDCSVCQSICHAALSSALNVCKII